MSRPSLVSHRSPPAWRMPRLDDGVDTVPRQWMPRTRSRGSTRETIPLNAATANAAAIQLAAARVAAAKVAAATATKNQLTTYDIPSPTSSPVTEDSTAHDTECSTGARRSYLPGRATEELASGHTISPMRPRQRTFESESSAPRLRATNSFHSPPRHSPRPARQSVDRYRNEDAAPRLRATGSFHSPRHSVDHRMRNNQAFRAPRAVDGALADDYARGEHVLRAVSSFRTALPRRSSRAFPRTAALPSDPADDDNTVSVEEADSASHLQANPPTRRLHTRVPPADATLRRLRSDAHPSLTRRTDARRSSMRLSADDQPALRAFRGAAQRLLPRRASRNDSAAAADIRVGAESVKMQLSSLFGNSSSATHTCTDGCPCGSTSFAPARRPLRISPNRFGRYKRAQSPPRRVINDSLFETSSLIDVDFACAQSRPTHDAFSDTSSTVSTARVH